MSLRRFLCNITAVAPVLVAEFDWIEKNQAIFEVSSADPARFTKETLYIQKALMAASSSRRSSGDVVEASRRALGHLRRARTLRSALPTSNMLWEAIGVTCDHLRPLEPPKTL